MNKEIDWLSQLHDSLLTDILSRLKAEEVIQTCLLSKRWRHLWASVPCLDFEYKYKDRETSVEAAASKFEHFVSTFLRLRANATDLHSFRFCHEKGINFIFGGYKIEEPSISASSIKTWTLYALKHNIKKLEIKLCGYDRVRLSDGIFTCESLEDVKLKIDGGKIKSDKIKLPRLKTLHLGFVSLNSNYMEMLLSGCPGLESLTLSNCNFEMNNISFQTLKRLFIRSRCSFRRKITTPCFSISAPQLEYFFISLEIEDAIKLKDMSKVTKATVSTDYDKSWFIKGEVAEEEARTSYNCELLSGFPGVETLEMFHRDYMKEILETELPKCPTFLNLKTLSLGQGCMSCCFDQLCTLLNHCPNLEFLTLWHTTWSSCKISRHIEEYDDGRNLDHIEKFSCDHLKLADVRYDCKLSDADLLVQLISHSTVKIEGLQIMLTKYEPF